MQLIEAMFAGHSWQSAVAQSHLPVSRATSDRLVQRARNEEQVALVLLAGRHGLGRKGRDQDFGASYRHCGWQRLLPFFKLGGWIRTTASEGQLEFCAFPHRALVHDGEEVCPRVNAAGAILPDGRRLVVALGERLRVPSLNGPLAQTGCVSLQMCTA